MKFIFYVLFFILIIEIIILIIAFFQNLDGTIIHPKSFSSRKSGFFCQFNGFVLRTHNLMSRKCNQVCIPSDLQHIFSQPEIKTSSTFKNKILKVLNKVSVDNLITHDIKQISKLNKRSIKNSPHWIDQVQVDNDLIKQYDTYHKYFRPIVNPNIFHKVNNFTHLNFNHTFVLGVHLRSPQHYFLDNWSSDKLIQKMIFEVEIILSQNDPAYIIFIATHVQDIVDKFKQHFPPGRVVTTYFKRTENPLADWTENTQSKQDEYKNVFIDANILSHCDHLIGGPSQVLKASFYLSDKKRDFTTVTIPSFFPQRPR